MAHLNMTQAQRDPTVVLTLTRLMQGCEPHTADDLVIKQQNLSCIPCGWCCLQSKVINVQRFLKV